MWMRHLYLFPVKLLVTAAYAKLEVLHSWCSKCHWAWQRLCWSMSDGNSATPFKLAMIAGNFITLWKAGNQSVRQWNKCRLGTNNSVIFQGEWFSASVWSALSLLDCVEVSNNKTWLLHYWGINHSWNTLCCKDVVSICPWKHHTQVMLSHVPWETWCCPWPSEKSHKFFSCWRKYVDICACFSVSCRKCGCMGLATCECFTVPKCHSFRPGAWKCWSLSCTIRAWKSPRRLSMSWMKHARTRLV